MVVLRSRNTKTVEYQTANCEIKNFINLCENMFENTKIVLEKNWRDFLELLDKKNASRKECLLLPLRTVLKALRIS